jgi:hypothetical protein
MDKEKANNGDHEQDENKTATGHRNYSSHKQFDRIDVIKLFRGRNCQAASALKKNIRPKDTRSTKKF